MFTDRFITVPCMEYDIKHKDLTGEEILVKTYERINPFEISNYRPILREDDKCVSISFKNGEITLAYLSIDAFENLLNNHTKEKV